MTIIELREKRNKAWEAAKAFAETHTTDKGTLTAEDTATYERMEQEIQDLSREIQRRERQRRGAGYVIRVGRPAVFGRIVRACGILRRIGQVCAVECAEIRRILCPYGGKTAFLRIGYSVARMGLVVIAEPAVRKTHAEMIIFVYGASQKVDEGRIQFQIFRFHRTKQGGNVHGHRYGKFTVACMQKMPVVFPAVPGIGIDFMKHRIRFSLFCGD